MFIYEEKAESELWKSIKQYDKQEYIIDKTTTSKVRLSDEEVKVMQGEMTLVSQKVDDTWMNVSTKIEDKTVDEVILSGTHWRAVDRVYIDFKKQHVKTNWRIQTRSVTEAS